MNLSLLWPRGGVPRAHGERVLVDVGEGDRVLLHFAPPRVAGGTVAVIVHGFTSSADARLVRSLARKCAARGFGVARVNTRGSGASLPFTRRLAHAGLEADLCAVLAALQRRVPESSFALIGISMGGNVALRAAAALAGGKGPRLSCVAGLSPVVDVARCARDCDSAPHARLYRAVFLRSLRARVTALDRAHGLGIDRRALAAVRTLRAFDDLYTAPLWGHASADEYWARASALPVLEAIEVPILAIAARDDLLVPFDSLRPLRRRSGVKFLATAKGGHCAFVARARGADEDRYWAENRIVEFLGEP
jgi:predicted alpha/beta-fold hydrolase